MCIFFFFFSSNFHQLVAMKDTTDRRMIDIAKGKKHGRKRKGGGKVITGTFQFFKGKNIGRFRGRFTWQEWFVAAQRPVIALPSLLVFFLPPQPSSGPSTVNNRHTPHPPGTDTADPGAVPPTCKAPPLISRSVQIYYCIDPIPFSTSNPLPLLLFPEYPRFTF